MSIASVTQTPEAGSEAAPIFALQHIRRMRGGSQSHLMLCSDNNLYVIKFRNNPQHLRVLANEMLASRLTQWIGLPTPCCAVVQVDQDLIRTNPELCIQLEKNTVPCEPGLQFGSQYAVHPVRGRVWDYLPAEQLHRLGNIEAFAGILAVDKWLGNIDRRQVVFWRCARGQKYNPAFIDYGLCFNGGEWNFVDAALQGTCAMDTVYKTISGWNCFEPWLSKIESMPDAGLWEIASQVPTQWYSGTRNEFEELIVAILGRRQRVRELIDDFRRSARQPFPFWN